VVWKAIQLGGCRRETVAIHYFRAIVITGQSSWSLAAVTQAAIRRTDMPRIKFVRYGAPRDHAWQVLVTSDGRINARSVHMNASEVLGDKLCNEPVSLTSIPAGRRRASPGELNRTALPLTRTVAHI